MSSPSPDPDLIAEVIPDIKNPRAVPRLLVGNPSRDELDCMVLADLLGKVPADILVEAATQVVTALIEKAERSQGNEIRTRCFQSVSVIVSRFAVNPTKFPRKAITAFQFWYLAPIWGSSNPCGCSILRQRTPAREFALFRAWHTHVYCGIPGDCPAITWAGFNSALIKRFAYTMINVALREIEVCDFPFEMKTMIAQFLVLA